MTTFAEEFTGDFANFPIDEHTNTIPSVADIDLSEFDYHGIYTLRDGHIVVSPFAEYPGEIVFPKIFTGKLYKTYIKAVREADENEALEGLWSGLDAVRAKVKVDGMGAWDENDIRLNRWAVAMLLRWVNPFLANTPWVRNSGNGAEITP